VLSTQDFAMIDERMTKLMCNVGNIVSFRVGHKEAQLLSREIGCTAQDIQFIEKYHVAYRTPNETGFAQAPRPPMFRKLEVQTKVEPKKQSGWFPLVPLASA
jgi:hypothetical protein